MSRFELPDMESEKPEITVHRAGDREDTIEFVCTCGCRTTVRLEFDTADQKGDSLPTPAKSGEEHTFSEAP